MKEVVMILVCFLSLQAGIAQTIDFDKDQCTQCNMLIRDRQFAAYTENHVGETQKFDAIECLINFLKSEQEGKYVLIQVADYVNPGRWIDAKQAIYLKSNSIPSPMGAYLSAYSDREIASKVQKQKGGELFTWTELKAKFESSNFGSLNHPDHHHNRSDAYASIGVMGDHLHHKDGWMVSLRHMYMQMEGNQSGTSDITNAEIYDMHMAAPQKMNMEMYMLGIMFAPTDRLTISLMQSFLRNEMQMQMPMTMPGMGGNMPMTTYMDYETQSNGLGDLKLSLLYSLWSDENTSFHLNTGVSIPHGNIENTDNTPMSEKMKLPYAMQLGSGTLDLIVGGTFKQSFKKSSIGIQPMATIRTGENDQGYRFGNLYRVNGWFAYGFSNWISLTVRSEFTIQEELTGRDVDLNEMMAPQANAANYGLQQFYTFGGLNLYFPNVELLRKMSMGIEFGAPLYRDVEGIQMKDNFTINSGVRYML